MSISVPSVCDYGKDHPDRYWRHLARRFLDKDVKQSNIDHGFDDRQQRYPGSGMFASDKVQEGLHHRYKSIPMLKAVSIVSSDRIRKPGSVRMSPEEHVQNAQHPKEAHGT